MILLQELTTSDNIDVTGTITSSGILTSATGSKIGSLTLANGSIMIHQEQYHSVMKI